ncbi:hypothetical protein Q9Q94_15535 [Uliginosibacterium sp. 31-16]|uniref:hypothetical protein n=1 Tax=Uliginosibacterium sp. 31-16 TaxID=3068315 RepID=UPI00274021A2|nr:hypothetical protein [Uliginosibacterium sp. 31-16]MDP5240954.1 hypothetical protein [Uliginosibacterium sp. 31-16]
MPALSLSIDGITLATVSTDGLNVLNVRVGGTVIADALADLDMSGGAYPDGGESTHLIWIGNQTVQAGQVIKVTMLTDEPTIRAGKTIDEFFAEDEPAPPAEAKSTSKIFDDLRNTPKRRSGFSFRVESSAGKRVITSTRPGDFSFDFSVLWDSWSPDCAKVSVHSCSLDELEQNSPMHDFFRDRIRVGESIEFELTA